MSTADEPPYLSTPAEILGFQLRQIATRLEFRIEAINERGGETVGLSLSFAQEIERCCRKASEWIAPPIPEPAEKPMPEDIGKNDPEPLF